MRGPRCRQMRTQTSWRGWDWAAAEGQDCLDQQDGPKKAVVAAAGDDQRDAAGVGALVDGASPSSHQGKRGSSGATPISLCVQHEIVDPGPGFYRVSATTKPTSRSRAQANLQKARSGAPGAFR
jgi:hypothetical protein